MPPLHPDSARDRGAVDRAEFGERMHFIGDLYRANQEREGLLGPPFNPEQVAELRQGRVPPGRFRFATTALSRIPYEPPQTG